ncbi:hypothetical protein J113_18365 [Mycobacterium tuberculosis CAS/NITR204]|uniref:Uncharacterized protein n=1 Tax=Mycobacterium tuberculosis CAS/NITR204 TaxID=1310114 RepID=R4MJE6_MYCTX|nr:hypothetical protein J113_18365 [Mycobacterium tuberculosis CAS/NITR204]
MRQRRHQRRAPAGYRDLQLLVRKQLPQFGFGQFGERDVRA